MTYHLFVGGCKIFSHHHICTSFNITGKPGRAVILNNLSKIAEELGAEQDLIPALYSLCHIAAFCLMTKPLECCFAVEDLSIIQHAYIQH